MHARWRMGAGVEWTFDMINLQYFKYELLRWWERRSIRPWVNRNIPFVLVAGFVLLAGAIAALVWVSLPEKVVQVVKYDYDWYYDLNTDKLFKAVAGQMPPIAAPSGPLPDGKPAGVRAYVFSYSDDPNTTDTFIGFLETTDPNVPDQKPSSVDLRYEGAAELTKGRLVRPPDKNIWFPANSRMGRAVINRAFRPNKKGQRPTYVPPK